MKIVLICPSNILYMPYIDNYKSVLKENYDEIIHIVWDRMGIEEMSDYVFRDNKIGIQRNIYDYYKFYKFIIKILTKNKIDKLIIFGLQMSFFLKNYLIKHYKNNYIIDIRDYNKILKVFNPLQVVKGSAFTTISSPAYKKWLPTSDKYILNHNISIKDLNDLKDFRKIDLNNINISYIGSLANFDENKELINTLKNSKRIKLLFHGQGTINNLLEEYIKEMNIGNVHLFGRFNREQEESLYNEADFTNMLLYNKHINDETCLANRIYKSALYGKPIICFRGIYLSEIIEKYELGIVINSFDNLENTVLEYATRLDKNNYNKARISFLKDVIKDNDTFELHLDEFIRYK